MLRSGLGLLLQSLETGSLLVKVCLLGSGCICLLIITKDSEKFCGTGKKVTIAAGKPEV